jgi:hypothetical protein
LQISIHSSRCDSSQQQCSALASSHVGDIDAGGTEFGDVNVAAEVDC